MAKEPLPRFSLGTAGDGERGLTAIADNRPCLAVVDVGLPGEIDGLEMCRRLRSIGRLPPGTRMVVTLTANCRAGYDS